MVKLKTEVERVDKHYKESTSEQNVDMEWVKNHIDILRNELKSKFNELTEKMRREIESMTNLKVETNSKMEGMKVENQIHTQEVMKSKIENTIKEAKELVLIESKKIQSILDLKIKENTDYIVKCVGGRETKEIEFENQVKKLKQDSLNSSKGFETLKSNMIKMQQVLDEVDGKFLRVFEDMKQIQGK